MKEIDWSEAPEGATHWVGSEDRSILSPWEKHINGERYVWKEYLGRWDRASMSSLVNYNLIVERPTQWQGPQDGFPPARVECLVTHNGIDGWRRITVLTDIFDTPEEGCDRSAMVVYYHDTCKTGVLFNVADSDTQFQPIQSERDKVIDAAMALSEAGLTDTKWLTRLFDAGMLVDPEREPMTRAEAFETLNTQTIFSDERINMALDALGYRE